MLVYVCEQYDICVHQPVIQPIQITATNCRRLAQKVAVVRENTCDQLHTCTIYIPKSHEFVCLHTAQDSLQRSTAAAATALRTAAELSECQQVLQDSQAQYIATKSKLIATAKQLANTAKDHSSAIELQHDSDTTAADASHRCGSRLRSSQASTLLHPRILG